MLPFWCLLGPSVAARCLLVPSFRLGKNDKCFKNIVFCRLEFVFVENAFWSPLALQLALLILIYKKRYPREGGTNRKP